MPAASCAFKLDAVITTLFEAPAFNVQLVGLANNQFPPLLVCVLADHEPVGPQFVIVTVCDPASLVFAIPLKLSVFGLPEAQPPCTVKATCKDCVVLSG